MSIFHSKRWLLQATVLILLSSFTASVGFSQIPPTPPPTPVLQKKPTIRENIALRWKRFKDYVRVRTPGDEHESMFPTDENAFDLFFQTLKTRVKARVIGQDHIVDDILDQWASSVRNPQRAHSVVLLLGTTGVGKSFLARVIAEESHKMRQEAESLKKTEKQRIKDDLKKEKDPVPLLEIDMASHKKKESLSKLFGAQPGYIGYASPGGKLCNWLQQFARFENQDGGVIVLNEIDKPDGEVLEAFMEMLETGTVSCGDQTDRFLKRSLVILTANKNVENMLPDEFLRNASCAEIEARAANITPAAIKDAFTQPETAANQSKEVRREVLERIDLFAFASPMCKERAVQTLNLFLSNYTATRNSKLTFAPDFAQIWADLQYDVTLGVRGIQRTIGSRITTLYRDHRQLFGSSEKVTIGLSIDPNLPFLSTLTVTNERGEQFTERGPQAAMTSPLLDPDQREKLAHVKENLERLIIGQPELVEMGAEVILSQATNPNATSPISVFAIGPTGTGKTELAYAIAETKCGNRDAVFFVDMGSFTTAYDFERWLNPPSERGPLEEFLRKHEDCGVLLFDETSNAGGQYLDQRRDIGRKFYTMLQQGYFESKATGKRFSILKHIPYFTGNTGEEFFLGLSSDDELEAAWQAMGNTTDKVSDLLFQDGFTRAFLGRTTYKVMSRPLLTRDKKILSLKQFNVWLKQMKKSYPMIDIEFDEDFTTQLATRVYKGKEGARSIENFITSTVSPLVGQEIKKLDFKNIGNPLLQPKIKLSIQSFGPNQPFFRLVPDPRSAVLHVATEQYGKVISAESKDFTASAQFMRQVLESDAWIIAMHEAAHAVDNEPYLSGQKLAFLTIVPGGEGNRRYLGYARYALIEGVKSNFTEKDVIAYSSKLIAGSAAETLLGRAPNTGRSGDIQDFRRAMFRFGVEFGLERDLISVKLDKEGQPILNAAEEIIFKAYSDRILAAAMQDAERVLKEKWILVCLVARELMRKHFLFGHEFDAIVAKYNAMDSDTRASYAGLFEMGQVKEKFQAYSSYCNEQLAKHYR